MVLTVSSGTEVVTPMLTVMRRSPNHRDRSMEGTWGTNLIRNQRGFMQGGTREHDHELLAAQAPQNGGVNCRAAQLRGEELQRHIPHRMAMLIVDALEVIDVDHENGTVIASPLQYLAQSAQAQLADSGRRSAQSVMAKLRIWRSPRR